MDAATMQATPTTDVNDDVGVLMLDRKGNLLAIDDCATVLLGVDESRLDSIEEVASLFGLRTSEFDYHLSRARSQRLRQFKFESFAGRTLHVNLQYSVQRCTFVVKIQSFTASTANENLYRSAFDCAGTGLALLLISGEWIAANHRLCEMLGYSETELRATSFQHITHPDDADIHAEDIRDLVGGHRLSLSFEKRYIRKDGSTLTASLTLGIVRSRNQEALYFVTQLEDISERLAIRQALLSSEKNYRLAVQNSKNIILRYNRLGQRVYANSELETSKTFLNTVVFNDTSTPLSRRTEVEEKYCTEIKKTLATGTPNTFILESKELQAGYPVDFLCSVTAEFDENGCPSGVLVLAQDISLLRRQERVELARSSIFQGMIAQGTLSDVQPLLSSYLKVLIPDFESAIVFQALQDDVEIRSRSMAHLPIDVCLAADVRTHPDFFHPPRLIDDLQAEAASQAFSRPALQAGHRKCWVEPIVNHVGSTVGGIVLFISDDTALTDQHRKNTQLASQIASIAWERFSTLENLAQSERRYREIFDHSQDMLCLLAIDTDRQFICLEANPKLCEMLDKPHAELIGRSLSQCMDRAASQIVEAICEHCITVGAPIELDAQVPCGEQSLVIHFNLAPVTDASGHLQRLVCIGRNITDIRDAQRNERARQQEIGTLVENSPDGIARLTPAGELLFINPALENWLDRPKGDLLRNNLLQILPNNLQSRLFHSAVIEVAENGRPLEHEYVLDADPRLKRVYHISLVPELNVQGKVISVLAVGRDISALRAAEQRLASLNSQLRSLMSSRESAREEERKLIAQEIHDELGQHLTAIRMGTSLLRFQYGEQLPPLKEQVTRLLSLIDETVQVVRNISTSLRPSILNMGLAASLEWLTDTFTQQWSITCDLHIAAEKIELDDASTTAAFRIAQESLTNVARHADATKVRVTFDQTPAGWMLEITDNGKGFDQRGQPKKTLGLLGMRERGLTLGGVTNISSSIGSGTTVQLRVPNSRNRET